MLISDEYRQEQTKLHENPHYGVASVQYAPLVTTIIDNLKVLRVLDYGAGKGRLGQSIEPGHKVFIDHYDPAIPDWSADPQPAEMVCCIDVLEHIEPDLIDNVLDHLKKLTLKVGFFTIHTGPAVKVLSDGRNAHLIQEDYRWWMPKLWQRFSVQTMQHVNNGFYVVVFPL